MKAAGVLIVSLMVHGMACASPWLVETVDSNQAGYYNSIVLDDDGNAQIAYCAWDGSSWDLMWAGRNEQTGWATMLVDGVGSAGTYCDMALGSDGTPHISYREESPVQNLCYATWYNSAWQTEIADSASEGYWTSIALKPNGYPMISHFTDSIGPLPRGVKYSEKNGGVWSSAYIEDDLTWHTETAIGVVGSGQAQVGYMSVDATWPNELTVAEWTGPYLSNWTYSVVGTNPVTDIDMITTYGGYSHLAYYGNYGIGYAYESPTGWVRETVSSDGGRWPSITLNNRGVPFICYGGPWGLTVAHRSGPEWVREYVDTTAWCRQTGIAIDHRGRIHCSYEDNAKGELKYARAPSHRVRMDYDGDGISDLAVYRPSNAHWYIKQSRDGVRDVQFGYAGVIPVSGDFDNDGKADIGCYDPNIGQWYLQLSKDGFVNFKFGFTGTMPVTGDFDGDGATDYGVWHPPSGTWYVMRTQAGFWTNQFGFQGCIPVTGDFDGDGKGDYGCYHPDTGLWFLMNSTAGFWMVPFGYAGTVPMQGDYDGDGRADGAVYDPGTGQMYVMMSVAGFSAMTFISAAPHAATGDFDGDGCCDFGTYDQGIWRIETSSGVVGIADYGAAGDIPLWSR